MRVWLLNVQIRLTMDICFFSLQNLGQYELAKLLVSKGSDVNATDSKNLTPLMFAAHMGACMSSINMVELSKTNDSINQHGFFTIWTSKRKLVLQSDEIELH